MITQVSELHDYTEAQHCTEHNLPYDFPSIFPLDPKCSTGDLKNKFKLLNNIDEKLQRMLYGNERVLYICSGVENNPFEQAFAGAVVYYINKKAFVFTTMRIILIQLKGKNKPWDLYAQIPYQNIVAIKKSFWGYLKITLANNKAIQFVGMPKYDQICAEKIADVVRQSLPAALQTKKGIEHLCPHCYVAVEKFPTVCPHCSGQFKSAGKAGLLSLLFPGLGDMYLGHRALGAMEIIGGVFLWFAIIMFFTSGSDDSLGMSEMLIVFAFLIIFGHGVDALVTWFIGKKGLYPGKNNSLNS